MSDCSWLATVLDQEMLETGHYVPIASRTTRDADLPRKSGTDVWSEMGHRYLVRYLASEAVSESRKAMTRPVYVTPTAYAADALVPWLALPAPLKVREYALLIDPRQIEVVLGPRWVRFGKGIEYVCPDGFGEAALVLSWQLRVS